MAAERPPYLAPEAALGAFELESGLRIDLVAAEPLVVDPVAFAFDAAGRLYIAEGRGYPEPIESPTAGTEGRVVLLEDTDGDGRFDRRKEFATGLGFPNGIALWDGGVFVTDAPRILYLKDTDGDGVADEHTVVLTGFDLSKTTQLRVSHPTLGWDGRFYVAGGRAGGAVSSPLHPGRPPTSYSSSDGRFDPRSFVYEAVGGQGQFGFTFDAYGRRFTSSNRDPLRHVVLEPWHLARNPHLAVSGVMQEVAKSGADAKVSRISQATITSDFNPKYMSKPHAGTFTSACSPLIFGGTGLSAGHMGDVFICEPAQNLVQRQVIRPHGASFRSELRYEGREFLASRDSWFRPVFAAGGPDGALYIADMHRREIDHPQYVPEEMRDVLDFGGGKGTTGRIYRIARDGPRAPARTAAETTAGTVRELESPDAWWRERARRVLWERRDPAAVPLLESCAAEATLPESRAAALWVLHGLEKLSTELLVAALRDPHARVREQAVLIAQASACGPALLQPLLRLARDRDARVRFVTALLLGDCDDSQAVNALASIAVRDGEDSWTRAAVFSGIGTRMAEFSPAVAKSDGADSEALGAVMEELGRVLGAGGTADGRRQFLTDLLAEHGGFEWRLPAVLGLAEGLHGKLRTGNGGANPLAALLDSAPPAARQSLETFFTRAERAAAHETAAPRVRTTAVALLGHTNFRRMEPLLDGLLDARQEVPLQLQAVRAVERMGDPRGAEVLLQPNHWSRYTPQVKEAVLGALFSQASMIEVLFRAIRGGTIAPTEISSLRRGQLLKHSNPGVRKAAESIFAHLESGDRMKVYREHRDVLAAPADAGRGAGVFVRTCSACHTFEAVGGKVGPDLTGMRHQPADALLLHILVPNYEVAPDYQMATLTTTDGRALSGSVAAETDTSVTLRTPAGTEETVLRSAIRSLSSTGASLMPDGLEQTMTRQELADLIAYLKQDAVR